MCAWASKSISHRSTISLGYAIRYETDGRESWGSKLGKREEGGPCRKSVRCCFAPFSLCQCLKKVLILKHTVDSRDSKYFKVRPTIFFGIMQIPHTREVNFTNSCRRYPKKINPTSQVSKIIYLFCKFSSWFAPCSSHHLRSGMITVGYLAVISNLSAEVQAFMPSILLCTMTNI